MRRSWSKASFISIYERAHTLRSSFRKLVMIWTTAFYFMIALHWSCVVWAGSESAVANRPSSTKYLVFLHQWPILCPVCQPIPHNSVCPIAHGAHARIGKRPNSYTATSLSILAKEGMPSQTHFYFGIQVWIQIALLWCARGFAHRHWLDRGCSYLWYIQFSTHP